VEAGSLYLGSTAAPSVLQHLREDVHVLNLESTLQHTPCHGLLWCCLYVVCCVCVSGTVFHAAVVLEVAVCQGPGPRAFACSHDCSSAGSRHKAALSFKLLGLVCFGRSKLPSPPT